MNKQDKENIIHEIQMQGMYTREDFHKEFVKYYVNNSNRTIQTILFFGILINLLLTAILFIKMDNDTKDGNNHGNDRNAQSVSTETIIRNITNPFGGNFEQENGRILGVHRLTVTKFVKEHM